MNAIPVNSVTGTEAASRNRSLGELLVVSGYLQREKIELVLFKQRRDGLMFGEAAIRLGLISEQQLEHTLLLQFGQFGIPQAAVGLDWSLHTAFNPFGLEAEAIRRLRSQLSLRWFNNERKVLAIVGAHTGDGCSALAANLAISYAQLGERTMLIDANLRRPVQHKLFAIDMGKGLSGVLSHRTAVKDAITTIPAMPGLTLLCAGPTPPNPQELLAGYLFNHVMEVAQQSCDIVIVDTPALLHSADAQIIVAKTGGCILSLWRHRSSLEDIAKVKDLLAPTGVTLLGTVLNA